MVMYKPVVCLIGGAGCPVARLEDELETTQDKIAEALSVLWCMGQYEGESQHQTWLLDQVVRYLAGDQYDDWVRRRNTGQDGEEMHPWSTGTPP